MGRQVVCSAWEAELEPWLEPFLSRLQRAEQRFWAPVYVRGLLLPGERKSVEPMASRVAPGDVQQLHHFVSASPWPAAPLEAALVEEADRRVGGREAVLIIDDTALVKQGKHSVGVAHQYCGELGKRANCQSLVSLTLAQGEVPVPVALRLYLVALRLYLPETWTKDPERCKRAGVPQERVVCRPKWRIALEETDRVVACGGRFGYVLADAGYGMSAEFRHGLSERGFRWAVGILPTQHVYAADVELRPAPRRATGRPPKHPVPTRESVSAEAAIAALGERALRSIVWRRGTKGALRADFAALRVRVADGPKNSSGKHLPGQEVWLICERRANGERKYYLSNLPKGTRLGTLARLIKARWSCEQAHEQMKNELGLDHFEGRNWRGLHHHALLCMLAYAFLQHLRLGGKAHAG